MVETRMTTFMSSEAQKYHGMDKVSLEQMLSSHNKGKERDKK